MKKIKKFTLFLCLTAMTSFAQTSVREEVIGIDISGLERSKVVETAPDLKDTKLVLMPDKVKEGLENLKLQDSAAYECHVKGRGDFVKLIPGKCETEGLNQTSKSMQSISELITKTDFVDVNKELSSAQEMDTFYFGNEESCVRCSGTSDYMINEVRELITKKESELRLEEGATTLRNMIMRNILALNLTEPLTSKDIGKVTCQKKYKKLLGGNFLSGGNCEENFLKSLKNSESFGATEGALTKDNLSKYLYNSVKDNTHRIYISPERTLEVTLNDAKDYFQKVTNEFSQELQELYSNGQLEEVCNGKNIDARKKLEGVQSSLKRFIGTKKMTSTDEICEEYFLAIKEDRAFSVQKDIVSKSRSNVGQEVEKLCEESYAKIDNLICNESEGVGANSFRTNELTGDKGALFKVAEDLKGDESRLLALKSIACMNHDNFLASKLPESQNSNRSLHGSGTSSALISSGIVERKYLEEAEGEGEKNDFEDKDYNYFSDYSPSFLNEGTFVMNRRPGFSLGGESYSFGGEFGDGLGSFGGGSTIESDTQTTYDFESDQVASNGADSDSGKSYLGQWSERFGQGTNTISPSDPLEQSFTNNFGANSYNSTSNAVSRAYVPSALEDSISSQDANFISDDQEIQDLLKSKELLKDQEIAELKNEIDSLKEDKQKTILEKAQADYEKLKLENEELKKIAQLKKEAVNREPASIEPVSFNTTSSPFSSSSSTSEVDEPKTTKESYKSVTNFVSAPSSTQSFNNQASSSVSTGGGVSSNYSGSNYNTALTAVLKTDNASSPDSLDSGVSNIISSMLKEGTVSTIYISRKEGIDTVVFEDQSREVELKKFSPRTQKLIKEYVAFSEKKKVEEKRDVVLDLDELNQKESELKLALFKKAIYSSMADLDPKWAKKAENY